MSVPFLFLVSLILSSPLYSIRDGLSGGSSLSVEKPEDVLISPNGVFSTGFYPVGENAYCFAIWFTKPLHDGNLTVVWMANRDQPVNGRLSKLSLEKSGNLVLTDAGQFPVWATNTVSNSSAVQIQLGNDGNLFLRRSEGEFLWHSFDSPTDTLLPQQKLTKYTKVVSSRSKTNYSSGFYELFFDNDNVLRLLWNGLETTDVYWPDPWLNSWEAGRSTYNYTRAAVLDSSGQFNSTDDLGFKAADFGVGHQRRLTVDYDGNLRLYSLDEPSRAWKVSWQAFSQPCKIHGICGPNSLCNYEIAGGRKCSCIPGYRMKNHSDWSYGCRPDFKLSCKDSESAFFKLLHVEFYGYDRGYFENCTLERCEQECLKNCECKGFQYKFLEEKGVYQCFIKNLLLNGYDSPGFKYPMYIKLPKSHLAFHQKLVQEFSLDCPAQASAQLERSFKKKRENEPLKYTLRFVFVFGGLEIILFVFFMCFVYRTRQPLEGTMQGYLQVATGFKRFTYDELKKASRNFSEEVGRGSGGIVYKGVLSDNRVAAIKRLNEASLQGEAGFLAEVTTIGRLNHMNLIETWGYCAEGKHRLLVYEFMNHGSLAENLHSNRLDWKKRFEIAVGTAKGLAYLHEECLEWVLHCDVKPQNILLDSNYKPKVADFGLSAIFNRGGIHASGFSRIRGTRGYMAPEWVLDLPITSKVDVYSYGIVMLEMIAGRGPTAVHPSNNDSSGIEQTSLVTWVREKMQGGAPGGASWVEEIADPAMDGEYDMVSLEMLVKVALQCAEEDRDERPTMNHVVDMLVHRENYV